MSVLTKKRPTSKTVQITIENKKRGLFLVPKDKADSIQALIEEYRVRDFVPANLVLSDIHQEYGKLGSVLKGYRIREEMTQVELAKKMDCPQSWISGWESGGRSLGKKSAEKLAKIFKTDYRVFL